MHLIKNYFAGILMCLAVAGICACSNPATGSGGGTTLSSNGAYITLTFADSSTKTFQYGKGGVNTSVVSGSGNLMYYVAGYDSASGSGAVAMVSIMNGASTQTIQVTYMPNSGATYGSTYSDFTPSLTTITLPTNIGQLLDFSFSSTVNAYYSMVGAASVPNNCKVISVTVSNAKRI